MDHAQETQRKHPARPFIITLAGMIVVFGTFLLLLLLSGDGGSGNGSGGGKGNGLGSGIGTGTGTGSGGGDGSGIGKHAGAGAAAMQPPGTGNSKTAENQSAAGKQPEKKSAAKPAASGKTAPPKTASSSPDAAAPVQPPKPLIPYQIPAPANAPAPGPDTADSGPAAYGTGSGGGGGGGTFYGVRSLGNTLYIVDTSSSMGAATSEGPARIAILKQQLINAVRGRHRKESMDKYSIIAFNSSCQFFPGNGKQARFWLNGETKKLQDFAQALAPCGCTAMMIAWQEAVRQINSSKIDTVCFLTDGEPTDCSMPDLISYIQQNIPAKTVIHTIVIGMENTELQNLAKKYNGTYRSIR